MKETMLIGICLVVSIIGIIIMFLANKMFQPHEIKISEISEKDSFVKLRGKVTKISRSKSGTSFLKVKDESGTIDVIIFKDSIKNVSWIKTGYVIEVVGKAEKYKEKLEIIASQIKH